MLYYDILCHDMSGQITTTPWYFPSGGLPFLLLLLIFFSHGSWTSFFCLLKLKSIFAVILGPSWVGLGIILADFWVVF